VGGKTGGAIWVCLVFWLHLLHQGKRWNNIHQVNVRKEQRLLQQCFPSTSSGKLAQHDKAQEASAIAISIKQRMERQA
jgi:hypothetical protein